MPFSNISETTAVMVVAEELCQNLVDRSHGSPGPNGSDRSSAEFRFNPPFPRGFDSHGRPGPVQIQSLRSVRAFGGGRSVVSNDSRGSLWEALRQAIPRQSVRSFVRCVRSAFVRPFARSFVRCVRSGGRAVVSNHSLGALWKAFRRAIPPLRRSIPRQSVRCVGTVRPPGVPDPRSGQNGSIDRRSFARSFVRSFGG